MVFEDGPGDGTVWADGRSLPEYCWVDEACTVFIFYARTDRVNAEGHRVYAFARVEPYPTDAVLD